MAATQIQLLPGEEIAFELEADLIKSGTSPIQVMIARAAFFIGKIFGTTAKTKLIVTTKRVVQVTNLITCYCIPTKSMFQVIMPNSVKEVGYYVESALFGICKTYMFYYQGLSESNAFFIKSGSDELLSNYTAKFYAALNAK